MLKNYKIGDSRFPISKPTLFATRTFLNKGVYFCEMIFENIFATSEIFDIDLKLIINSWSPFLNIGVIKDDFKISGNIPNFNELLNKITMAGEITNEHFFRKRHRFHLVQRRPLLKITH